MEKLLFDLAALYGESPNYIHALAAKMRQVVGARELSDAELILISKALNKHLGSRALERAFREMATSSGLPQEQVEAYLCTPSEPGRKSNAELFVDAVCRNICKKYA